MRLPTLDGFSFWLGFFTAWAIVGLLYWFRQPLGRLRAELSHSLRGLRERLTAGTERNWRQDLDRYAQTTHLAGALFPLDDILVPPRFWVPAPEPDPARPPADEDLNAIIPRLPEWPELASAFRAPTLDVAAALAGDQPVVILGAPGAGKTTVLAHLASRAAQGDLTLFPGEPTPLFVHAADLELSLKPHEPLFTPLVGAAQLRASALTAATLARHLRLRLREFNCVIFLDGFDDLTARQAEAVADWLIQFRKAHPGHRVIAASGLAGYGPLTRAGFAPLYLAPWSVEEQRRLLTKWSAGWPAARERARLKPDPIAGELVAGWLSLGNRGRSPLELTLKFWAGFAGDPRGPRPVDWCEAYLLRHGVAPAGLRALGKLALAALTDAETTGFTRAQARERALSAFQTAAAADPNNPPENQLTAVLENALAQRLLVKQGKDRLAFPHQLSLAYCAATALAADPEGTAALLPAAAPTPAWLWTLYFLSALGDVTPVVQRLLTQPPDILQSETLVCARWLRDAPPAAAWRNEIFRRLSKLLLDASLPEALRLRALGAFVAAGDFAVASLFKQALTNKEPFTRRLAALGLGVIGDGSATPNLTALFTDPYLDVRWAAALALAALGTDQALGALRQGFLNGDDAVRQACAQALARNAEIGLPLLKESLAHPDLATRRSALVGLAEVGGDEVLKLVEERQKTEQEWLVRNTANEITQRFHEPPAQAPQPYTPPEAQGWLISWAAAHGQGVPPGRGAVEVLNLALREGDEPVRLAAIEALARLGEPTGALPLYAALRDPQSALVRDAAYRALAELAAATGQRLHAAT